MSSVRARRGRRTAPAAPAAAVELVTAGPELPFYRMQLGGIWQVLLRQRASMWLLLLYLFFEYVRPQSIYEPLKGYPWASWILYLCLAAFFLEGNRFRPLNLADGALIFYTLVVLVTSFTAWSPAASRDGWVIWFSWMVVYWLITNILDTEEKFFLFLLAYFLFNLKMSQHGGRMWVSSGFSFRKSGITGSPGWFMNSGEFGTEMDIFFAICLMFVLALKPYWGKLKFWIITGTFPILAVIGVAGSSSRGAQLGLGALVVWLLSKTPQKMKALGSFVVVGALVLLLLPEEQKARFTEAGEDHTSQTRLTYWEHAREIIAERPVFGIGYHNWLPYYRSKYNPEGELVHNIFYEAWAEMGYFGLAAFVACILATLVINHRTRKLGKALGAHGRFALYMAHGFDGAMIGFLVSGMFVTILYYPFFWINLAFTVALHYTLQNKQRRLAQGVALPSARTRMRRGLGGPETTSPHGT